MSLRVYAYEKCDTCRRALKFLAAKKVAHEVIPIRAQPPTVAELRYHAGAYGRRSPQAVQHRGPGLLARSI